MAFAMLCTFLHYVQGSFDTRQLARFSAKLGTCLYTRLRLSTVPFPILFMLSSTTPFVSYLPP